MCFFADACLKTQLLVEARYPERRKEQLIAGNQASSGNRGSKNSKDDEELK
jgi:hypothetical protein